MDTSEIYHRLQEFLAADIELLQSNFIGQHDGGYHVFDQFDVTPVAGGVEVRQHDDRPQMFSSLKVAVSWCVATKYQESQLAQEISRLDQDDQRITTDIDFLRRRLAVLPMGDRWDIAKAKLDAQQTRRSYLRARLTKCVNRAKYIQLRGFNDEIARTRRPAPHRSNRPSLGKPSRPRREIPKSSRQSRPRDVVPRARTAGRTSRS